MSDSKLKTAKKVTVMMGSIISPPPEPSQHELGRLYQVLSTDTIEEENDFSFLTPASR